MKKINKTNPETYCLEDHNEEIVHGKYYEQQLLKSVFNFKNQQQNVRKYEYFSYSKAGFA